MIVLCVVAVTALILGVILGVYVALIHVLPRRLARFDDAQVAALSDKVERFRT